MRAQNARPSLKLKERPTEACRGQAARQSGANRPGGRPTSRPASAGDTPVTASTLAPDTQTQRPGCKPCFVCRLERSSARPGAVGRACRVSSRRALMVRSAARAGRTGRTGLAGAGESPNARQPRRRPRCRRRRRHASNRHSSLAQRELYSRATRQCSKYCLPGWPRPKTFALIPVCTPGVYFTLLIVRQYVDHRLLIRTTEIASTDHWIIGIILEERGDRTTTLSSEHTGS